MRRTLELRNRIADLVPVLDEIESLLLDEGLRHELVREVRLVAEEAVSNVIRHAYESEEDHRIQLDLTRYDDEVRLEVRDDGRPFDPLQVPAPDLDAPIEERPGGGLGIHLIRTLADEMSYRRESGCNILVVKKRL